MISGEISKLILFMIILRTLVIYSDYHPDPCHTQAVYDLTQYVEKLSIRLNDAINGSTGDTPIHTSSPGIGTHKTTQVYNSVFYLDSILRAHMRACVYVHVHVCVCVYVCVYL